MSEEPNGNNASPPEPRADATTSEQSASFMHPDTAQASGSQRLRLMPPDGKPLPWWVRHSEKLMVAEVLLTVFFFLLALYFLWLWIFTPGPVAFLGGLEGLALAFAVPPPANDGVYPEEKPTLDRQKLLAGAYTAVSFFVLAGFLLWLLVPVPEPPTPPEPEPEFASDREGFLQALFALPPPEPAAAWRVPAKNGRWRLVVVHHTGTNGGSAESIDRYHREVNKWENGLGYHFLIGNGKDMPDGEVTVGKRWFDQLDGAHIKEMRDHKKPNTFAIGIALVGNFEDCIPSAKQLASLRGLLRFLVREYGIEPKNIIGHGQAAVRHTACPGKLFFLDDVIATL